MQGKTVTQIVGILLLLHYFFSSFWLHSLNQERTFLTFFEDFQLLFLSFILEDYNI